MSKGATPAGQTTTTTAPPSYMYPYIGTGLSQAGNIYNSTSQNPWASIAPFNPVQQQAMGNTANIDNQLTQSTATNPFLNSMFTQAAQAVEPQLASQFAGSGRSITGSIPLASQQLNNLANTMYGSQYENNVQNAMQAGQQELGIGNQIQGQTQALINAPWTQLSQYSGALGGFQPGSATSNPYFTNPTANALGSAAALGSLYNSYNSGSGGKGAKGSGGAPASGGVASDLGSFMSSDPNVLSVGGT